VLNRRNDAALQVGSFELICNFVEPGLNAGLVDPWRTRYTGPADNIIADLDRQPAGYCDNVRQGYLLANDRIIIGEALGIGSSRSAKASRGIGFAARVFHRVRAGVVTAQGDDDLAGTIDDDSGDGIATGLAALDRRFRDRFAMA